VCGILDFGDVTVTALVNDVAIAVANQLGDDADLLGPTLDLIAGYHATTPLTAGELGLLPDLILGRIVARIIISDLAVMGKPMGNGMPIAGVAARPEILAEFGHKIRYFNTFGGNSVCIAAAAAVLDVIEAEGLLGNALIVGRYLRQALEAIAADTPRIGAVRGAGLYAAADLVHPDTGEPDGDAALRVVNGLRGRRVLISATGPEGSTLKIRPPLLGVGQRLRVQLTRRRERVLAGHLGPAHGRPPCPLVECGVLQHLDDVPLGARRWPLPAVRGNAGHRRPQHSPGLIQDAPASQGNLAHLLARGGPGIRGFRDGAALPPSRICSCWIEFSLVTTRSSIR
jgi:Aminotransferase class-III